MAPPLLKGTVCHVPQQHSRSAVLTQVGLSPFLPVLSLYACSQGGGADWPLASLLCIRLGLVAAVERSLSGCVFWRLLAALQSVNPALTVNPFLTDMSMKLEGNLHWR